MESVSWLAICFHAYLVGWFFRIEYTFALPLSARGKLVFCAGILEQLHQYQNFLVDKIGISQCGKNLCQKQTQSKLILSPGGKSDTFL
jgi:hypothetical protein